jgi:predicted Kef-type K+ transport protein
MPLVTTMAAAFGVAWVLGIAAQRLRLSPIVGYLLAGVLIGPHTPGLRADVSLASQLAEIGVVLLMFGVGLHFRVRDLREVGRLAIPGALVQSTVATLLGLGIGLAFGWPVGSGLVLGMALSVASTVVLLRGLEAHNLTTTPAGHAAIGWLIVEDILTVLVLVVIPVLGQARASGTPDGPEPSLVAGVALAFAKLVALVAVVFVLGSRLLPSALVYVARLQSRELFTLTILAIAIAIAAGASVLFGASMALGAFLAGMVVGRSEYSLRAASEALPMRDAFAVLFFVSVGMLEHVGLADFRTLGQVIACCLDGRGRGLLHFIGRNQATVLNPWIRKRIFPGAYPPTLREVFEHVLEPHQFSVLDVENLRLHYAKTLEHWHRRFEGASDQVQTMFDGAFVRAWRLYLAGSEAAFSTGSMQLFQVVFAPGASNAIPWTRPGASAGASGATDGAL